MELMISEFHSYSIYHICNKNCLPMFSYYVKTSAKYISPIGSHTEFARFMIAIIIASYKSKCSFAKMAR